MLDFYQNVKHDQVVDPATITSDTDGSSVDLLGYSRVVFYALVGESGDTLSGSVKIELEVDTLDQLEEALGLGIDAVLLDNMDVDTLREAVARVSGRMVTEASGGITLETAAAVAATGVDLLSVGALTHSAPALDVGLDID